MNQYSLFPHHLNSSVYSSSNSSRFVDSLGSDLDMQLEPLMDKRNRRAVQPEPVRDAVPFETSSMAIYIPGLATTPETSRPGTLAKWYFYMTSRQAGEKHNCDMVNGYQPPLRVYASCQRINWTLLDKDMSEGLYDITLGLSIEGLMLETIESISITVVKQSHSEPTEIITSKDLRNMKMDPAIPKVKGAIRLRLHQQVLKSSRESKGDIKFVMDIRTFPDAKVDSGSIVLYYMETCQNVFGDDNSDRSMTRHKPYTWSFNFYGNGESDYDKVRRSSKSFSHIAVSGDGFYVVTLATLVALAIPATPISRATQATQAGLLVLEVWDVRNSSTVSRNIPCAKATMAMAGNASLDVAVSWSASMIALLDISPIKVSPNKKEGPSSMFKVFTYQRDDNVDHRSQSRLCCNPEYFDRCPSLSTYIGNGRFHFMSSPGVDLANELFVTCDGKALNVYNPFKQWSHIRHIPLDKESSLGYYDLGAALSKHLRGSHLALASRNKQHITVWNIEKGAVVSFMDRPATNTFALSSDGLLMAFARRQHISLHYATTGTMIGACQLQELTNSDLITGVSFIEGDKRIMVETNCKDPGLGPQYLGFIIDTTTLTVEDRYFMPSRVFFHSASEARERLVCLHHYTLDLVPLEDRIVSTPALLQKKRCDDHCTVHWSSLNSLPTALLVPSSGLHFKAQRLPASVAISASKISNPLEEKLIFQAPGEYDTAAFLASHSCLIVQRSSLIMIWKLPRTTSGNLQLILVHNLGPDLDWRVCREQRIFSHNPHVDTSEKDVYLDIEHPFTSDNSKWFVGGVMALVQQFVDANETYRDHIFHYLGRHINTYPDPEIMTSVLGLICSAWSSDDHELYCSFLKALLSSPFTRWIPQPDLEKALNPLMIFLDLSKKDARIIALAEIIIDYCIDAAKVSRDSSFLAPVARSLATLVERKGPHSELALKSLRGFAHVPVSHRSYVIDHHTISYPPEECWKFWTRERTKLFQTPDPILQLSTLPKQDPSSANFTRELYAANFDLLWKQRQGAKSKFGAAGNLAVECHPFDLKELDNPAIAALVDYKWNTIGYRYWLVRFLSECCYYVLVLVAIFKQVYGDHTETLPGLFIAVIAASAVFLFLEAVQYFNNPNRYFSPTFRTYNIADLLAFLSPMLFELRVVKSVCHFVTIIIQVIRTIRVFFFVFAGGILGFTVAILHLLRGCLNSSCSNLSKDFPTNFFESVSAVYFVMGGRYDPFDNDFKSGNWAFHLMLIVFFFFTVILMLNVLIALINLAFNNGDQTWRLTWLENRMRYVESAENMTYIFPGFREKQSCFPSTVFYSATPQQVRNYDKETKRLIEDFAPTVARPDGASKGGGGEDDITSMQLYFEQKQAINNLRSELENGIKGELQGLRDENAVLRAQVGDLQQQLSSLPGQIVALLRADKTQPPVPRPF
ncbi:hypothetical protein BG015_004857 [Linnemannia schmuckeri]|uniref:Ion transport domain-containing protein n=1 Tax=Linnemannia schmuckeri TaxID=64567 RepID=A0A9P5VCU9_9FUNG|nr:hypothetical protein BG015_004857 [Linnemannia schmuckeri]